MKSITKKVIPMSEDSIRILFNKVDELIKEIIQMKTLLNENIIVNQRLITERLDRHRKEINELKDTKKELKYFKSAVLGLLGLIATLMAIIANGYQLLK